MHNITSKDELLLVKVRPIIERTLASCEKILQSNKSIAIEVEPTEDKFILQKWMGLEDLQIILNL